MNFDFLDTFELGEVTVNKRNSVAKVLLPEEADLRLFSNGKLYPSKTFAENNMLEFRPIPKEGEEAYPQNGLDIFSSEEWGMVQGRLPQKVMFLAVVPKSTPKIDVFGTTRYELDGTPKSSVFTQGGGTFVKQRLMGLVADVFDINWDIVEFVDLKIVTDKVVSSSNGVYQLPTVISTGPHKGSPTYKVRNNIIINPLALITTSYKAKKEMVTEKPAGELVFGDKNAADMPITGKGADFDIDNTSKAEPAQEASSAVLLGNTGVQAHTIKGAKDPGLNLGTQEPATKAPASDWASAFKGNPAK
jgi:hypothetical protein